MNDYLIPIYLWENEHGHVRDGRDALEIGNPVILYKPGRVGGPALFIETTVARSTKTQVTTADGTRHYRRNGQEVGMADSWVPGYVLVAADERILASYKEAKAKADRQQAEKEAEREAKAARRQALEHPFWKSADAESVAQVVALMDAWKIRHDAEFERQLEEYKR